VRINLRQTLHIRDSNLFTPAECMENDLIRQRATWMSWSIF
jgi:hypothetical protein